MFGKILLALALVVGVSAQSDSQVNDWGNKICSVVDGLAQGTYHYFDCLEELDEIKESGMSLGESIYHLCSKVPQYLSLSQQQIKPCITQSIDLLVVQ